MTKILKQQLKLEVDIKEDEILKKYPNILEILLLDQSTKKNIFWASHNYEYIGDKYKFSSQITTKSITGFSGKIIMPRILKNKELQKTRVKDMAEVYTPSWVCNEQINTIDHSWFNKKNVFNTQIITNDGSISWVTNRNKIKFPKNKTWKDYVANVRLEISCGEAPYLTSRYDTTTGIYINVKNRIGFLDRKLRIINENIKQKATWLKYVKIAYKSIYGYEYHGDSLLLARESLLYTFIDNYIEKFNVEPNIEDIQDIAIIISWNIWQMDGLKCVVPNSCISIEEQKTNIFNSVIEIKECIGCKTGDIKSHTGIYCKIMNWYNQTRIKFIDLIQK